jgi:hypothetical protein
MERARVIKEELFERESRFLALYIEAENSCLILLSEKEDKLGTLAIAVPKHKDTLGPVSSAVILGDRYTVSARMFAEQVAVKKGKITLVSIYLEKCSELQAQSFFTRLIEKVTQADTSGEALKT